MLAFSSKRSTEQELLSFDFTKILAVSETLVSAAVTTRTLIGTDDPTMVIGGSSILGNVVTQMIGGGTEQSRYAIDCTATTSAGQVLVVSGSLLILSSFQ